MNEENGYKHLGPRQGSNYRQFFIKGTRTRAETIYRRLVGPEPRSPEEVARDSGLPIEAVLECLDYCHKNEDLLRAEREEELLDMQRRQFLQPPVSTLNSGT